MANPKNAGTGWSPKVEKSRLNHTTSGLHSRMVFSRRTGLLSALKLQQRSTL